MVHPARQVNKASGTSREVCFGLPYEVFLGEGNILAV
jgi:hypothetical protein